MPDALDARIRQFYAHEYDENARLRTLSAQSAVEFHRVQTVLRSQLAPGSRILDVGGATGIHSEWLAADGHRVTLLDPVPEQVEKAAAIGTFEALVGDARNLPLEDASVDAVLLFGPLYHLESHEDRLQALDEARRVLVPGGRVFAQGISRLGVFVDGVLDRVAGNQAELTETDTRVFRDGHWINHNAGFPGGHFHVSSELAAELTEAGFADVTVRGLEAPTTVGLQLFDADEILSEAAIAMSNRIDELLDAGAHASAIADLATHLIASGTAA